jgi:hypothetical protein
VDRVLERQKILEEKINQLEHEMHSNSNAVTEKDFVEVNIYSKYFGKIYIVTNFFYIF